jgi:hypothetical protein
MTWYFNTDRLGRDSNSYYSKLEQEIQYIIKRIQNILNYTSE